MNNEKPIDERLRYEIELHRKLASQLEASLEQSRVLMFRSLLAVAWAFITVIMFVTISFDPDSFLQLIDDITRINWRDLLNFWRNLSIFTILFWAFFSGTLAATVYVHRHKIPTILEITWLRHKVEVTLAFVAVGFFISLIFPEISENGWNEPKLRTMYFTLFGIVGLMGLSVGIKRNELMERERFDYQDEKRTEKLNQDIERTHDFLLRLNDATPHVVITALSELRHLVKSLSAREKELTQESIAAFVLSAVDPVPNPADTKSKLARNHQIAMRQLAMETTLNLCDNWPAFLDLMNKSLLLIGGNKGKHLTGLTINNRTLADILKSK